MSSVPVDVAVGVLIRPDGSFLIAQRPAGKPMAGYWEFPGGKLEPGETVFDALKREFMEELGLLVTEAFPWAQRVFVYPHATVRLHFWRVFGWLGEPQSLEGQAWCWENLRTPKVEPWLPGALPLRRWLDLPATYDISNATEMGMAGFLASLDRRLAAGDLDMLQLREPGMDEAAFGKLFFEVRARTREHDVRLLVSSRHAGYGERADGLHLTAADLHDGQTRSAVGWCAASCHDVHDIALAGAMGVDCAVLGPIRETASHPGAGGIGWDGFTSTTAATPLPVYALGGLDRSDLAVARRHGAQGVALMRAAWI